jgi:putative salt-induced outer membrane protein YdiY
MPLPAPSPESIPVPPALAVPPVETMPAVKDSGPPLANTPMSLSGMLSNGLKIDEKPDPDKVWDGSFDLGLDGSQGNTEAMNFRFGFHAQGKGENSILMVGLDYNKRTNQSVATTDRLFFDSRLERLFEKTSWSVFFHETIEYDEFQPFNVRDTSDAGFGYRVVKNDITTLIGRLGGGFSHEFGGPENGQVTPEAVFGAQLEQKIGKRQKFLGSVEYAPDVADFDRYRVRSQAALELLLDQAKNLCMRIGVLERYNSHPNGARPNDLDYATTLMWKF